ncbi:MAG: UDP-N-acetylmuramate dehydrogenase [Oscillospiraceae bacterium]|nr:UDP-N-acetylmuramate dehydrogenase [Oscillospiraceae bacterium]
MRDLTSLQKQLNARCALKYFEPMCNHTSFRIGGEAEIMAFPKNTDELADILHQAKELGVTPRILGAGTNVLAPDGFLPGVVICLKDHLDGMELLEGDRIRVMAGVTMTRAAVFAARQGLSGLEFAHGIPGTVGGGVFMNAGAYDGDISAVLESAVVMGADGSLSERSNADMRFSYRHSILEETGEIVISAVFSLRQAPPERIKEKMRALMEKRSASQPLELPSAGSAFKRPVGGYAAALIDEAGLKGYRVGGAAISTKHAGFAVNLGGATAADVKALLKNVSDIVYEKSGIRLEPEVRIW